MPKHTFPTVDVHIAACLEGHAQGPRAGSRVVHRLSAQLTELDLPRDNSAHPEKASSTSQNRLVTRLLP